MRQLVGEPCVFCQKTVDSILEGRFCDTCGSAYHYICRPPGQAASVSGACVTCGSTAPPRKEEPEQPVAIPLPSRRQLLNWARAVKFILAALAFFLAGIWLLRDRSIRVNPRELSPTEILYAVVVMIGGLVCLVLAYLTARRK